MAKDVILCTRCARPNKRGGRTRICLPCFKQSPQQSKRLPKAPDTKVCSFCRTEKDSEEFYKNSARYDWLSTYCKTCHSAVAKESYDNDEDLTKSRRLWQRYNITLEDFRAILRFQDNSCGLCRKPVIEGKSLHVDHSHEKPFVVRGLLCHVCNTRKLGALKLIEVEGILSYLKSPPALAVIGSRVVPIGKEKGARHRRKRVYRQYPPRPDHTLLDLPPIQEDA